MRAKKINESDINESTFFHEEPTWMSDMRNKKAEKPKDTSLIEKMLDEFEEKVGPLDETDYDVVDMIKSALWIGYNFKKQSSRGGDIPSIPRGPRGDMDSESWGDKPDWRGNEMGQ